MKGANHLNPCIIRSEQVSDYHAITLINARAFQNSTSMAEAVLVNVLRGSESFDPDLSLVAVSDNQIVGHVLFTPKRICIRGEILDAVLLAPVAVSPEFQKQGVGTLLIEEGHRRAKEKGYQMSLLIGHPSYYPRFGYRMNMWSSSQIKIALRDIPSEALTVKERRIEVTDIEAFDSMWDHWFMDAHLAIKPGTSLTDWISPSNGTQAAAVEIEGQLAGYLRYDNHNPSRILSVLTRDAEGLIKLCSYLASKLTAGEQEYLCLPLSPESSKLGGLNLPYRPELNSGPEKMIKILVEENKAVTDYCNEVALGVLDPGAVIWPVDFDVC